MSDSTTRHEVGVERRDFLKLSGSTLVAWGFPSATTFVRTAEDDASAGVLVVVLLRGAADGLHMVIPYRDPGYRSLRGALALEEPGRGESPTIDLGDGFAFHPALSPLHPHYRDGRLAVAVNTGSPDPTRSHFDAQDYMDSGTPGKKSSPDGWLARAVNRLGASERSAFAGVALSSRVPRTLAGTRDAIAIEDFDALEARGRTSSFYEAVERAYADDGEERFRSVGEEAFRAVRDFRRSDPGAIRVGTGAAYPPGRESARFQQLARLLRADLGVRAAVIECDGWDTHFAQGREDGQMAGLMSRLARSVAAFVDDTSGLPVTLLVATEFGRTVAPNGAGGTDHGHGGVVLALGEGVRGGKVHGDWLGLRSSDLYEGRDLPVTLDFRDVFAEAATVALGRSVAEGLFPGHHGRAAGVLAVSV